ncbi:MAG: hypothetical protein OES26_09910 [Gammaproteobacteria bacterium]|nr:hypothetical protein [Gammaproteobacteria bacterium]
MSGGDACSCLEREKPPIKREWVVWKLRFNTSAFNGYKVTPSDYSTVHCQVCGKVWRTKAAYVDELFCDRPENSRYWKQTEGAIA